MKLIKLGELAMTKAERALEPLGVRPRHLNVLAALAADDSLSQQDVSRRLSGVDELDAPVVHGARNRRSGRPVPP